MEIKSCPHTRPKQHGYAEHRTSPFPAITVGTVWRNVLERQRLELQQLQAAHTALSRSAFVYIKIDCVEFGGMGTDVVIIARANYVVP